MEREYALYKGDELLALGTLQEISEQVGAEMNTLKQYRFPSYQKRYRINKERKRNTRVLVCLDGEDE